MSKKYSAAANGRLAFFRKDFAAKSVTSFSSVDGTALLNSKPPSP